MGYELLFRGGNENVAMISDHDEATSTVVVNAFTELGLDRVAGPHRAWINVSRDFVVREMAHALPPDRLFPLDTGCNHVDVPSECPDQLHGHW